MKAVAVSMMKRKLISMSLKHEILCNLQVLVINQMWKIREKKGFVMTPNVLIQRPEWMVVQFTNVANRKGRACGGVNHEFGLTLLSLLCFCDIQAVILWGSQKHGSVTQVTDLGLQTQNQELKACTQSKKKSTVGNNQHRSGQKRDYVEVSILAVCFGVSWAYVSHSFHSGFLVLNFIL